MLKKTLVPCLLAVAFQLQSQVKQELPKYEKEQMSVEDDWLLGARKAETRLCSGNDGQLILSNGLVIRIFTTYPNVATIGLDELPSNTSFLRSIRPEASVVIDGFAFDIGGLDGQKVHNYLLKEWIPELTANPMAFKMKKYSIEETKPRFSWKKRPDWMHLDMPWPTPGKELIFTYRLDQQAIDALVVKSGPR